MRSEVLIVACPNLPPRLEFHGAVAARRTGCDTVHLVSAAASPLGGDVTRTRIIVEPGARLRLRSVAATVALPGGLTVESHACWLVEAAGELDVDLQPTVVAAGAHHHSQTRLHLTQTSAVHLRERVQIGRTGEQRGFWAGWLRADVDDRPLLRHRVELGAGSSTCDELAAPRACVSEFHYPDGDAVTHDTLGVRLQLAGGGSLATWQGDRLAHDVRSDIGRQ